MTDRLPCGVSIDTLLAQVSEHALPRDPKHQASCPHCRAAIGEITAVWQPVADLAAQDVRAPAEVIAAVMKHVRDLPRLVWHVTLAADRGQTRIAARVIAAVARLAALDVPNVSGALSQGRDGGAHAPDRVARSGPANTTADVGISGSHIVVDVQVAVDFGAHIPTVAQHLRSTITAHLRHHTGLTVSEVNVAVIDVVTPHAAQ